MNSNINCSTVSFFTLNPFNVNYILFSVYLDNFANLLASKMSSYNLKYNNLNIQLKIKNSNTKHEGKNGSSSFKLINNI
jgi:hypothetical protein